MHDDDRVIDARSGGHREHDRVAEESVGKMIEHVGLVLFLAGRGVQPRHLVEDVGAPGVVEDATEDGSSRRRGGRQLERDRDAIDDHGETRALADVREEAGRLRPGVSLARRPQPGGVTGATRHIPIEIELGDPAVAPEVLVDHRRWARGELLQRCETPLDEPLRAAETPGGLSAERNG